MNLLSSQFENKQTTKLKVLIDHQSIYFLKKCLGARLVLTCLGARLVLTCLRARHVSGQEMSQGRTCSDLCYGRTCLRSRNVLGPDLSQGLQPEMSRAGSVSGPEVSKSLGPEVSRGRKCLGANYFIIVVHTQLTQILSFTYM